jgi:hypothetical protein
MKVDRDKRHRRFLQFYLQHFRLKAPYRVISMLRPPGGS